MTVPKRVLVATEAGIAIRSTLDVSDAVSATFGTAGLILAETDLAPEFFDLKTGLAGECLRQGQSQRIEGRPASEIREATRSHAFGSPLPREDRDIRTARPSENTDSTNSPASTEFTITSELSTIETKPMLGCAQPLKRRLAYDL